MLLARELEERDIPYIVNYWLTAAPSFLQGLGVDLNKMPTREQWMAMLHEQLSQPYHEKKAYATIWEIDGVPVGHCNVNKIVYAQEAYMHLHLWNAADRIKGAGTQLVKKSIVYFFNNLALENLFCEPYAFNPAPNKTLKKVGFQFVKEYLTVPGHLNFEQPVCLWQLSKEDFKKITGSQIP
jgi:RimJ/RimL family protein N-acetyltransferase